MEAAIAPCHSRLAHYLFIICKLMKLIVDFPSHPRGKSFGDNQSASRSVRFSSVESMTFFQGNSNRYSEFYSSEDKRRFEIELAWDARRMTMLLAAGPPAEDVSQETRCTLIGIEKLVPPDRARRARGQGHIRTIVSMQDKCTAEELGRLSQASSKKARKAAQELAAWYWNDLKV